MGRQLVMAYVDSTMGFNAKRAGRDKGPCPRG